MRIGLIGAGAIGRQIIRAMVDRCSDEIILLRRSGKGEPSRGVTSVTSIAELIAAAPDCVIEATRQEAVAELVPPILAAGIPVILCSTGALADEALRVGLIALARDHETELVIPGGAVAGLDYLRTVSDVAGTRVTYTSRKPPAAWHDELLGLGHDPARLQSIVMLFEGTAGEAAQRYPRNLNVAMTLSLAAGGAPLTVRVLADPQATGNTHEIDVDGPAGAAHMVFRNAPLPENPKTSAITALSALHAARSAMQKSGLRLI